MALGYLIFMSVVCINVKKDLNILFGTDLKKTASELNISLFICKYKYNFFKGGPPPLYNWNIVESCIKHYKSNCLKGAKQYVVLGSLFLLLTGCHLL